MLDLKALRENPDHFKTALAKKKVDSALLDQIIELDEKRRHLLTEMENQQAEQNKLSKEIQSADASARAALVEKSKQLKEAIKNIEPQLEDLQKQQSDIASGLPNLPDASVPEGKDEHENKEIMRWGEPAKIENPQDHVELGTKLGILDLDRATKITGTRFSVMKGLGAKLERALAAFMLEKQTEHGYDEVIPPYLVNAESLFGTGQLPKFEEDLFKIPHGETSLYLIPTAEVPVTNLYRDEILEEDSLPIRHCALTPCFRSEAGSYGKDTKGIIRQHQFHKVELVSFVKPAEGEAELERLTSHAEAILQALELPYRKVLLCGGDMGFGSAKTYDLEVWVPSQNTYREISSCSWFTDFQARRAAIRYKGTSTEGKTQFVHTLNGSGLAVGRTWVAVVENYQQPDGSITIPRALRPYMGGLEKIALK
ncbi:MAG: serine--tRNA ligase [Candidatus Altimarinota bacterium]